MKILLVQSEMVEDPGVMPFYRGDMIVALKYIPGESSPTKRTKKSKGALHVIVKEAKGLIPARPNGNIDALCKGWESDNEVGNGKGWSVIPM